MKDIDKSIQDAVILGTGFWYISDNGKPVYVDPREVFEEPEDEEKEGNQHIEDQS